MVVMFLLNAFVTVGSSEEIKKIDKITEKIVFSAPELISQQQKIKIEIEEANKYLIEPGKPVLPCYEKTFIFPLGTKIKNVNVERENIEEIILTSEIEYAPAPKIASLKNLETIKHTEKEKLDGIYPKEDYTYKIGRGIVNGQRSVILKTIVYPNRYDFDKKTLEFAKNIKINVEYEKPSKNIVFDDQYSFIILTPSSFAGELNDLVSHKNSRGVSTKVITLNEIYNSVYFPEQGRDEMEEIKYFIKNAYDNWGTTDVMIVGGAEYFPARETHIRIEIEDDPDDEEIFLSDLYYADIYGGENNFASWDTNENDVFAEYDWDGNYDEMDLYPDLRLGRLACIDNEEVETYVEKIIKYENSEAWTQNWFNNIVVIGGDTFPNENDEGEDIDEGEYVNQAILDIMEGFLPDKIWYSNGRLGGWSPTGVGNINSGLNNGCGFVDWSGHGAPWVWTTYPHNGNRQSLPSPSGKYTNNYISDLENGDKLPIAINGGCSLGKYNANENCFAWSYLSNPNGGGIASCGCTGLGWVYGGEYVIEGLVEGMAVNMFQAYKDGSLTFGEMWSDAINEYIYSRMRSVDYKTLLEWQPFGDPTLQIQKESQPPLKPETPSGESEGKIGEEYTYSTVTTDPDGDNVYYRFDWGDETYSNWLGPYESGETCDDGKKTWDSRGDYQVRVQAKDTNGKLSEWSNPMPVKMPIKNNFERPLLTWFSKIIEMIPFLETFYVFIQQFLL